MPSMQEPASPFRPQPINTDRGLSLGLVVPQSSDFAKVQSSAERIKAHREIMRTPTPEFQPAVVQHVSYVDEEHIAGPANSPGPPTPGARGVSPVSDGGRRAATPLGERWSAATIIQVTASTLFSPPALETSCSGKPSCSAPPVFTPHLRVLVLFTMPVLNCHSNLPD